MSEASPYGPYIRTGRGGAGNYQWQTSQDVEAQEPPLIQKRDAAGQIESIDTAAAIRDRDQSMREQSSETYTRVGRGGAGNYAYRQSNEPQRSPVLVSASKIVPVYTGRGGAGNYGAAKVANEQTKGEKEEKERIEAQQRREEAERYVVNFLQPPSQAYTGAVKRSGLPER